MSGLEQGERYRFNATAVNMFGASQVATSNFITAGIGTYTNSMPTLQNALYYSTILCLSAASIIIGLSFPTLCTLIFAVANRFVCMHCYIAVALTDMSPIM